MTELRAFVFSDLQGSVRLKKSLPGSSDAERDTAFVEQVLTPHRLRMHELLGTFNGRLVSTAGDGHFLVFGDAVAAARWAMALVDSHTQSPIRVGTSEPLAVRLSLHVGAPQLDPHDASNFVGKAVDYAARLNDLAGGGQVLISRATMALLEDAGLDDVRFHAHGRRRLKGIGDVEVFELTWGQRKPQPLRPAPESPNTRQWTVLPSSTNMSRLPAATAVLAAPGTGLRVGKYELVSRIATGGMGDVWLARHPQFDRPRALKVIKSHLVSDGGEDVIKRFYREIKAIGALAHPNVVVAIDSSTPDDATHFLVMEYIDGIAASDLVGRLGPLEVADACEIARQAAVGLDYIHRQGLVHRDIKPSNLMVTSVESSSSATPGSSTGRKQPLVKILDLGLALLAQEEHERLTRVDHRAMGTAMYMSPEQWRTTTVDIRSDIYSLGCTLYHLIAGRPPFFDSDLRPERAHQKAPVPPLGAEFGLPRGLWPVLKKMLAKEASERYTTPGEVAETLAPFCQGQRLVDMLSWLRTPQPGDQTAVGTSDTQVATGREKDTSRGRDLRISQLAKRKRTWRNVINLAVLLALLGGSVWGWQQWSSYTAARQLAARSDALGTAALLAGRVVAQEIDDRLRVLGELAGEPEVQQQLSQIADDPANGELWKPLDAWLAPAKLEHSEELPAESWFITSIDGTQVARAPKSASSTGHNYAHRDYFHGQGKDLPDGTRDTSPLTTPHQSAVYVSTTTGQPKVAFSVPISNGAALEADRRIVGVLAMSVDLGAFDVLEGELSAGQEVVLVDLRTDTLSGTPQRGLILHHHDLPERKPDEPFKRLSPELLATIDGLLASPAPAGNAPRLLTDYVDPLGRSDQHYRGAIRQVRITRKSGESRDTQWLVIVQERI